ncbi:MAG: dTDP-glucose 4,6-dehydratase [Candidatus Pacearchaeota archaeon]|jgi:dTDP-glucose 4,6-dehydratase
MKLEKAIVTGGAGFMGSHFLRLMVNKHPETHFINLDKLTYAGNLDNVKDLENKSNYQFVNGDICDISFMNYLLKDTDAIFHFAAESHVDNSIMGSLDFTKTNVLGTHVLLEAARANKVGEIVHISTDEVYGDIPEGCSKETDILNPTNPYSASKAAAEMIIHGYEKTYNLPVKIVRGSNNVGPFQYPEKLVAKFTTLLMQGEKVPIHGTGRNERTWIYVEDFARAVETVFEKGKVGEIYNIGTPYIASNLDITKIILESFGKDESSIEFVTDRPFNDSRYHVDSSKLRELGWNHRLSFEDSIRETVKWYKENKSWWEKVYMRMKK